MYVLCHFLPLGWSIVAVFVQSEVLPHIASAAVAASWDSDVRCWVIDFCFALLRTNPERVTHIDLSIKLMLFTFRRRSGAVLTLMKSSKLYSQFQAFFMIYIGRSQVLSTTQNKLYGVSYWWSWQWHRPMWCGAGRFYWWLTGLCSCLCRQAVEW
jgi:hypothetical protein